MVRIWVIRTLVWLSVVLFSINVYALPSSFTATSITPPASAAKLTTSYQIKYKDRHAKRVPDKDKDKDKDNKEHLADYCVTVEVRNLGPANVHDWRLKFDLGADALVLLQHGTADKDAGLITVTPGKEQQDIKKNHERKIKFCAQSASSVEPIPTITILSPSAGASLQAREVLVSGTYTGPDNMGITVNGRSALTDGYHFYANSVPLRAGKNIIEAIATTPAEKTAKRQIEVTSLGAGNMEMSASPRNGGVAPLAAVFKYYVSNSSQIQNVSMDFNGDGAIDFSTSNPKDAIQYIYNSPGIYLARLTITNTLGQSFSATYVVQVLAPATMDTKYNAIFSQMNTALLNSDVEKALQYMSKTSRDRYRPVFQKLLPRFPDIIGSYSPLQRSSVAATYGEYAVNRTINGVNRIFFIYFIQDEDGVWRIDSL
jgi:hypothetical protein